MALTAAYGTSVRGFFTRISEYWQCNKHAYGEQTCDYFHIDSFFAAASNLHLRVAVANPYPIDEDSLFPGFGHYAGIIEAVV